MTTDFSRGILITHLSNKLATHMHRAIHPEMLVVNVLKNAAGGSWLLLLNVLIPSTKQ